MKKIGQADIAQRLGISKMAVSKALRNKSGISKEMKKKVLALAEEMGYRPNYIAKSLTQGETRLIGIIIPGFNGQYVGNLLDGVALESHKHGYNLLPMLESDIFSNPGNALNHILQYQPDGLIVHTLKPHDEVFNKLTQEGINIVFIGQERSKVVSVCSDDFRGSYMAVNYLIERGHKHIMYVRWPDKDNYGANLRYEGYKFALMQAKIKFRKEYVVNAPYSTFTDYALKSLRSHPEITAISCFNDEFAAPLLGAMLEAGIEVPKKVSLIGFGDDIRFPQLIRPSLTTISQNSKDVGRIAVRTILDLKAGLPINTETLLSCDIIERESVASCCNS